MQQDAVDCASQAMEKFNVEKDIAAYVKKEFDKKYGATWHAVVGRNFGSYVTHETKHFIYFYVRIGGAGGAPGGKAAGAAAPFFCRSRATGKTANNQYLAGPTPPAVSSTRR
jgi:dynein light chain LC8-type